MINVMFIQKYNWSQTPEILAAQITDEQGLRPSRGKKPVALAASCCRQQAGRSPLRALPTAKLWKPMVLVLPQRGAKTCGAGAAAGSRAAAEAETPTPQGPSYPAFPPHYSLSFFLSISVPLPYHCRRSQLLWLIIENPGARLVSQVFISTNSACSNCFLRYPNFSLAKNNIHHSCCQILLLKVLQFETFKRNWRRSADNSDSMTAQ